MSISRSMKKMACGLAVSSMMVASLLVPVMASAHVGGVQLADATNTAIYKNLGTTGQAFGATSDTTTGKPTTDLMVTIGSIIQRLLGLLGIILVVLIIYAGYLWMMAQGDADQVQQAKDIIKNAVIGLIIMMAAYAITYFVLQAIVPTA
jgi:amino acid transporter